MTINAILSRDSAYNENPDGERLAVCSANAQARKKRQSTTLSGTGIPNLNFHYARSRDDYCSCYSMLEEDDALLASENLPFRLISVLELDTVL
jgi:hypothetical protein